MNQLIVTAFEEPLEKAGFRKKSGSWYLDKVDSILVVNLQKSNYGEQFYVNLAVWLRALGSDVFPKEHKCHIRIRLASLVGEEVTKCFDAQDSTFTDGARARLIRSLMEEHAIPFLRDCSSIKGIRRCLKEGTLENGFVHHQVEELAGSCEDASN